MSNLWNHSCVYLVLAAGLFSGALKGQVSTRLNTGNRVPSRDVYRVNCGGSPYVDPAGKLWLADFGFNTGHSGSTTSSILNTNMDPLYQTEREDRPNAPELRYSFPVLPFHRYRVELHFAEISPNVTGPGQRVFDVAIEGVTRFAALDPFFESGGADRALVRTVDIITDDATLDIEFAHISGDPSIKAIHVSWLGVGILNQPPAITSTPPEDATLSVAFTYDLDATDSNAGDVMTYSLSVAPTGANIDPQNGLIFWMPTAQVGLNEFIVRATDLSGAFDEQRFEVDTRYRINCGVPTPYVGAGGEIWAADQGFNTGAVFEVTQAISGTTDPELYRSERHDLAAAPEMLYSLSVENGDYIVRLHFAEIFNQITAAGQRVFDVQLEGTPGLVGYDVYAEAGGSFAAVQRDVPVTVNDGVLDIEFLHGVENPKISAIEVFQGGHLDATPAVLDWGNVDLGAQGVVHNILLDNTGALDVVLEGLTFWMQVGAAGHDYEVDLNGVLYVGDHNTISYPLAITIAAGQSLNVPVIFRPTEAESTQIDLEFSGNFVTQVVELSGIGGAGFGFLHVVIVAPDVVVDFDGDGAEEVHLNGLDSHTHEPGEIIISHEWKENGTSFSTLAELTRSFSVAQHTVELTIGDSATPQKFLSDTHAFDVVPIHSVPGVLVLAYDAQGSDPAGLLNNLPSGADYAAEHPDFALSQFQPAFNGSVVRLLAEVDFQSAGTYDFSLNFGGNATALLVDNVLTVGSVALLAGPHRIDAQFAVSAASDLPLQLLVSQGGGASVALDSSLLTHDMTGFAPVFNGITPAQGAEIGGNVVRIEGLGFFTDDAVSVQWGALTIPNSQLSVTPTAIRFATPPGSGTIAVHVNTPQGTSNSGSFEYIPGGPLPIDFSLRDLVTGIPNPTAAAWGPDGKLYVGTVNGRIFIITVDDDNTVSGMSSTNVITGLSNPNILGLAFNPFDPPFPVRIYVGHAALYADGGGCLTGAVVDYSGQVSVLVGPAYSVTPLVTNLPASNHDHAVNGLAFDRNGDMYINVGGNTNAGIPDCSMGGLPSSPLSGATLKAKISKPGFNGTISYVETNTGQPNNDQVFGDRVDVLPGVDVSVFGAGQRNAFDLVYTTWDMIYSTDNGPNAGFGASSTVGCQSSQNQPTTVDELNCIEFGQYYGYPNCNRARTDSRQAVWHDVTQASVIGEFTQALEGLPSSVNGITEYRAQTFNGAMRGNLIVQKLDNLTYKVQLSNDKRSVQNFAPVPTLSLGALDVLTGPGGTLIGIDHFGNKLVIAEPNDPSAANLAVYDISPWRARNSGGHSFVIGGSQFGSLLSNVSVTIGGQVATLTSVSNTRIHGLIPTYLTSGTDLVDVEVSVGSLTKTLTEGFRYLQRSGREPWGWRSAAQAPASLGEVAGGVIAGELLLVGEGNPNTYAYGIATDSWSTKAQRPLPGNHHASIVSNGLLYLFGGLGSGSEGRVQIYDPQLNSWSLGAPMPWAGGSCNAAQIGSLFYICGGIVGGNTVDSLAAYDPATDSWSSLLANMPAGRNHAAAGSNGSQMFVFGGRSGGNVVTNGFNDTQVYDPVGNAWSTSANGGQLAALPLARGGTGTAVFFEGEFYVMGGETQSGPGATQQNVYERVDIYNPISNDWRVGAPMPTARHGIWPVALGSQIYVACGGVQAANSDSPVLEVYAP